MRESVALGQTHSLPRQRCPTLGGENGLQEKESVGDLPTYCIVKLNIASPPVRPSFTLTLRVTFY